MFEDGSVHSPSFATHFLEALHMSDCLQSASPPTTHAPSFGVHLPPALQIKAFWQSVAEPTTHLPSFAVHTPFDTHAIVGAQSRSRAALHRHTSPSHDPVHSPDSLHGGSFLHSTESSASRTSRLLHPLGPPHARTAASDHTVARAPAPNTFPYPYRPRTAHPSFLPAGGARV